MRLISGFLLCSHGALVLTKLRTSVCSVRLVCNAVLHCRRSCEKVVRNGCAKAKNLPTPLQLHLTAVAEALHKLTAAVPEQAIQDHTNAAKVGKN